MKSNWPIPEGETITDRIVNYVVSSRTYRKRLRRAEKAADEFGQIHFVCNGCEQLQTLAEAESEAFFDCCMELSFRDFAFQRLLELQTELAEAEI